MYVCVRACVCVCVCVRVRVCVCKGWAQLKRPQGQVDGSSESKPENAAVKRLLKMESKVECTGDSMKLEVQDAASTPGSLFFVDRGTFSLSCGAGYLQLLFFLFF